MTGGHSQTGYNTNFTPVARTLFANIKDQETYSISGVVSTLAGAPLSGVAMKLGGASSKTTTTNEQGRYTFSGLSNGSYTLKAGKSGYTFKPASRSVNIQGKNVTGQNFTAQKSVAPPTADFEASSLSGSAPLSVQFTDKSTGTVNSWSWDFGDGGTSGERNPIRIYEVPGTYGVELTVSGPGGSSTEAKTDYIRVLEDNGISLSVPNGGEIWEAGTTQIISWSYEGSPGSAVKIELLENGLFQSTIVSETSPGVAGKGSYHWTIPEAQSPGDNYSVRIVSTTATGCEDRSDANFSITAPAVSVSVSPQAATLIPGGSQLFTATIGGSANQAVQWSIEEGSEGGSISNEGLYTAPGVEGYYHVKAASEADATRSAVSTVHVTTSVSVSLDTVEASLAPGETMTFRATVTGSSTTGVQWTLLEGAAGGALRDNLDNSATYTAPAGAGAFHVVATSLADTTKSDSATVNVWKNLASVSVGPAGGSVSGGGVTLSVPSGALEVTTSLVLREGESSPAEDRSLASKRYKLDGLPSRILKPLSVTITTDKATGDDTFLALGRLGYAGSLNKLATADSLIPATVSGSTITAQIPATEGAAPTGAGHSLRQAPVSSRQASESDNSVQLRVVTYRTYEITSNGHFKLIFDASFRADMEKIDRIADDLEDAYDMLQNDLGLSWSGRARWPIQVEVKKFSGSEAECWGVQWSSKLGVNYNWIDINESKLDDPGTAQEMRVTIGHELFHLLQAVYDPAWTWWDNYAKLAVTHPDPRGWLKEASSTWFEELMAGTSTYCPVTVDAQRGVFFVNGLNNYAGSATGSDQDHGYGSSIFLAYLVKTYGDDVTLMGRVWDSVSGLGAGSSTLKAIGDATGDALWTEKWTSFSDTYLSGKLGKYCFDFKSLWSGQAPWMLSDPVKDTTHQFQSSFHDLSAKTFSIGLKYDGKTVFTPAQNPVMNITLTPSAHVPTVFIYSVDKNQTITKVGQTIDKFAIQNLKDYPQDSRLLFIVVNDNASYYRDDPVNITLKCEISSITISPTEATLIPDDPYYGTKTFTAAITGLENKDITWSIEEGATGGTITGTDPDKALYTAPCRAGKYHIVASSKTNPDIKAVATVTVNLKLTASYTQEPGLDCSIKPQPNNWPYTISAEATCGVPPYTYNWTMDDTDPKVGQSVIYNLWGPCCTQENPCSCPCFLSCYVVHVEVTDAAGNKGSRTPYSVDCF